MSTREAVEEYGFAIIPEVLSQKDIAGILNHLKDATLQRSRAGVRHAFDSVGIARFAEDPRLLTVAQQILGPSAFPFRATLFDKSPAANWLGSGIKTQLCRSENETRRQAGVHGR